MMGKSHMMIGAAAGAVVATPETLPFAIIAGVVGAISPDVDHTGSTMGKALLPISWIVSKVCSHRGFTHSILAIGLVSAAAMQFDSPIAWAFVMGYASHILADMMTPMGCALASPFNRKFRLMSIRTGSILEPLVATVLTIGYMAVAFLSHPDIFGTPLAGYINF